VATNSIIKFAADSSVNYEGFEVCGLLILPSPPPPPSPPPSPPLPPAPPSSPGVARGGNYFYSNCSGGEQFSDGVMMYDGNLAEAVCITSPGYPSGYATNLICRWDVLEDDLFTWTEDFETERVFDNVWVTSSGTVVGGSYYSGDMDIHEIPPDATLGTGNAIHFYTDSSGSGRGFKMCGARMPPPRECADEDTKGADYNGTVSVTASGNSCLAWSGSGMPDVGNHNYCRNPNANRDQPWCFTTATGSWEHCDVVWCCGEHHYEPWCTPPSPSFQVESGDCAAFADGQAFCFTSPNYPDNYDAHNSAGVACEISVLADDLDIWIVDFRTEVNSDFLRILSADGTEEELSGSFPVPPFRRKINTNYTIQWDPDHGTQFRGFKICSYRYEEPPSQAPAPSASPEPPALLCCVGNATTWASRRAALRARWSAGLSSAPGGSGTSTPGTSAGSSR
jgi:hypothetical protein